jgi:hypothetical protein
MNATTASAKTVSTSKCFKCGGRGLFEKFMHINNGRCFTCGGTGQVELSAVRTPRARAAKPVAPVRLALRRARPEAEDCDADPNWITAWDGADAEQLKAFASRLDESHPDYAERDGWQLLRSVNGAAFEAVETFVTVWGALACTRRARGLQPIRSASGRWDWI